MSEPFLQLLDATILHLQDLKAHGVRFVDVTPETMTALAAPRPRSVPTPPLARAGAVNLEEASSAGHTLERSGPRGNRPAEGAGPSPPKSVGLASIPAPPQNPFATILSGPRPSTLAPEARATAMADLRARALACRKCAHLAASRQNVVFGVGDLRASLMFVGEAPGADEDAQGEPFVGKAGQLLTRIIQAMDFTRDTVYIANILKCRPDTPAQAMGNRKPTAEEMNTCLPYLLSQIDLIQPKVIVALGGTAVEGLFGKSSGITRLRGTWMIFRDTPVMPTFHPSFLLRPENAGKKRSVWEDMLQVLEKLGRPISEKQRNFFRKG
ncbi:MAG: uracil-DNA glycosylase [Limisphaerales bacterium]